MARLHNSVKGSLAGRTFSRFLRFGILRGLRSIEIDPEDFRRQLANKHQLWVPDFARMKDVPTERLDAIAAALIRDAERLALAEGAGLGLGGMITFLPDASLLTISPCGSSSVFLCSTVFKLTVATSGSKCGRRPRLPPASITARIWPKSSFSRNSPPVSQNVLQPRLAPKRRKNGLAA